MLHEAHERIARDRAAVGDNAARVIHVGDLVDRGPDAKGVLSDLIAGINDGRPWVVLKGNHDRMFLRYLTSGEVHDENILSGWGWLNERLGGLATLASYGIDSAEERGGADFETAMEAVPDAHVRFLSSLPLYHQTNELLFVHAGLRPGVALEEQAEDDLVWIREPFLRDGRDYGRLIVHGHTALHHVTHYGNRLNIDSAAGYGKPLSTVVIEGREAYLLGPDGREEITVAPVPEKLPEPQAFKK